jgi:hypothetical protein
VSVEAPQGSLLVTVADTSVLHVRVDAFIDTAGAER